MYCCTKVSQCERSMSVYKFLATCASILGGVEDFSRQLISSCMYAVLMERSNEYGSPTTAAPAKKCTKFNQSSALGAQLSTDYRTASISG